MVGSQQLIAHDNVARGDSINALSCPRRPYFGRHLDQLPRVVVFDFDGTLAPSEVDHIVKAGLPILHSLGFLDLTRERFEEFVRRCDPLGAISEEARERVEEVFWDLLNEIPRPPAALLPDIQRAFEALRGLGIEVALFTARPISYGDTFFEATLRNLGILQYLSVIEGRRLPSCYVRGSDKTDQIIAIAEALQVDPREMLVCGDTPADIEAGIRKNASYVAAVRSGNITEEALMAKAPDAIFDSVPDLVDYLEHVASRETLLDCRVS